MRNPMTPRLRKPGDLGALAGSRADERQKMISLRSRALGWNLMMIAAFIGLTVAIAVNGAAWWWPFLVLLGVGGFGYLLGLSNGTSDDDPAAEDDDDHQPAPVTSQR